MTQQDPSDYMFRADVGEKERETLRQKRESCPVVATAGIPAATHWNSFTVTIPHFARKPFFFL